jgi:hypothetical protein
MNGLILLVCLAAVSAPVVDVSTLAGDQHQGTLESFGTDAIIVKTDSASISIPMSELLVIRSTGPAAIPANDPYIEVRLVDGSVLRVRTFISSGDVMTLVHPRLGELRVAAASVSSVRLAPVDSKVEAEWNQLLERSSKKDMVAVRKGDVLDHLDGVIGSLNEKKLQFQLDGDDIAVNREKVFGLIYSKRESSAKKAIARLDLASGDRLALKQIMWDGAAWKARLVTGLELDVTGDLFQTVDYGLSKITYLSDLKPRSIEHTSYFRILNAPVSEFRCDKNFDGGRISLGDKTYARGLAIHSQTLLKYRLGGDYRRFQAVMGIGDEVPAGDVDVVIRADNRILFKGVAKRAAMRSVPQPLDIDVTGVVELEIFVGYGSDNIDIGDRLYLANARAVK